MLRTLNLFHFHNPMKNFLKSGIMSFKNFTNSTSLIPLSQNISVCKEMWKNYIHYISSGMSNNILGLYIFLTTTFKRKKLKMKKHKTWKRWKKIRNITKSNLKAK
jgi:hypothetical protein